MSGSRQRSWWGWGWEDEALSPDTVRKPGTHPAHPLADYAGDARHPPEAPRPGAKIARN
jgi:hypothetical protein